jgi:hypothetical protein
MAGVSRNPRPLFVTSLPAGYDGQEVFYQSTTAGTGGGATDTMATTGNVFHLRYRSASASSYKWEVIGAAPVSHASAGATSASVASGTWSQISATLDPRVTVPLAGEYYVRHAAGLNNTATGTLAIGVKLNTTEPSGAFEAPSALLEQTTAAVAYWLSAAAKVTMATANTVILQRYYKGSTGTTTLSLYNASLSVVPIRVG